MVPKKTDLSSAPDSLLKIIRCQCKDNWDLQRCCFQKYNLVWSSLYSGCTGHYALTGIVSQVIHLQYMSAILDSNTAVFRSRYWRFQQHRWYRKHGQRHNIFCPSWCRMGDVTQLILYGSHLGIQYDSCQIMILAAPTRSSISKTWVKALHFLFQLVQYGRYNAINIVWQPSWNPIWRPSEQNFVGIIFSNTIENMGKAT